MLLSSRWAEWALDHSLVTLFQPRGTDYAHHITDCPPGFETLTASLKPALKPKYIQLWPWIINRSQLFLIYFIKIINKANKNLAKVRKNCYENQNLASMVEVLIILVRDMKTR